MNQNLMFYKLMDRQLIGTSTLWKPILFEMSRVLIARLPESEQKRLVTGPEIANIITWRRMIKLPLEIRNEARTLDQWCVVLWAGLPRAMYFLWHDILHYLFSNVATDKNILVDYLQTTMSVEIPPTLKKSLVVIRTTGNFEFYEDRRLVAEFEHKFICSDGIETIDEATEFLENHKCELTEVAQKELVQLIQKEADFCSFHLDIASDVLFAQLYDVIEEETDK